MDGPQFFASCLFSTDCILAASLYAELFQGRVLRSSPGHSEILFSETKRVIFSRASEECPVFPGTLVWRIDPGKAPAFSDLLLKSGFFQESVGSRYDSFLDPWGNRIWLYFLE
ncbi:hypothetical protein EHO60_00070 [Leptospira fletcheri]|uniref:VOC family protein n=1 Tax=Leptospira fletcheri TaxID=2484981 RepID=A0A4R9GJA8_9LEPT|nr:hypothetical protein [Leptospira fletcheri]TGK13792.1 hypothetical protein EHO60_00070 [Leptospira fletcheri]